MKKVMLIALLTIAVIFVSGCINGGTTDLARSPSGEIARAPVYPEEYVIYRDYITTIEGEPEIYYDIGTIEATIISLTKDSACPYYEEKCSIEPYPNDIGIVRIDKFIGYKTYSERSEEELPHEAVGGEESEDVQTTPEYRGIGIPEPKTPEYEALQLGQEVNTKFVLTAKPAKITSAAVFVNQTTAGGIESSTQTVGQQVGAEQLPKEYKPIPKEDGYFVFTTKIIEYYEEDMEITPEVRVLSGLEIGDKFKAEISYDGTLYVEEYEIIS